MSPVYIILSIYLYKPISISIYLLYIEYIYISKSENFSLFFISFQSTQSLLCYIYDYNLTSYIQEQLTRQASCDDYSKFESNKTHVSFCRNGSSTSRIS
jgi:hypothetical protein